MPDEIVDPLLHQTLKNVAHQLTQQLRPHRIGFQLFMFNLDMPKSGTPNAICATNATIPEALAVVGSWIDRERAARVEREVKAKAGTNGNGVADTPRRRFELRVSIVDSQQDVPVTSRSLGSSDSLSVMAKLIPSVYVEVFDEPDLDTPSNAMDRDVPEDDS